MVFVKSSPIVFEKDKFMEENKLKNLLINGETDQKLRTKRAATALKDHLWDFGVIPYVIDGSVGFDVRQKARFKEAMDE